MNLLDNAIESIRLGVEDFESGTHPRLMSSMRNIHAGILLLYKEALRRLSPENSNEVLVKAKVVSSLDKAGNLIFIGKGTKTANTSQIRERFEGLNISTDWKRFDVITNARNDVEHYYPKLNKLALQGVIASAFAIIRKFVAEELNSEPRELLGETTWQAMLTVAEVYNDERMLCDKAIEAVEWPSEAIKAGLKAITCFDCGSDLLKPEISISWFCPVLICRACGSSFDPNDFVASAIRIGLSGKMYLAQHDGNEVPYTHCPECGEEAYIISEQRCALCGESVEHTCVMCGNTIPPEELDFSPYCGWCDHQMSKDD